MKRAGIPVSIIVGLVIIVGLSLYGVMTGFVSPNKAAASTQSLSTVSPSPQDCPKLKSQFAVPKTQCTTDNVKPRPLNEVSPMGAPGACWPAGQFKSPAEASDWLKSGQGQPRAEQYSTWFASADHKDYYRYNGNNGADFAAYVAGLVRVELPYPIRVMNQYCDANGVKQWMVQVLPKGKAVYFEAGYQPGNKQHHDIRPATIELCGNPLLPPPPPAPPATVTFKSGKPTPSHPGTTPPGGCTQPTNCLTPKDPNAGAGHKGNVEPGHLGTNPPITSGPQAPAGNPPDTYSPPAAPPAPPRQTPRPSPPAPEPSNPTVAPSQTVPPCTPRCG